MSSGAGWAFGLLNSMKDPKLILYQDDLMVIIKDKYPKARCHLLALPKENISSLKKLTKDNIPLLQHLYDKSLDYILRNHPEKEIRYGYHCIPSMAQVHMHIISQDFDSSYLKTKKHWNSFTSPYFINSENLLKALTTTGKYSADPEAGDHLKDPLTCHKCDEEFKTMPRLKEHLITHLPSED